MCEAPIGFGLMCKPPRPGAAKTRLAAAVGPEPAARLARAFLEDCAAAAIAAARLQPLDLAAFFRPADASSEIGAILGPRWPLEFADAGDLGATMQDILARLLRSCPGGAIIMGADIPLITGNAIAAAARSLREGDDRRVVLIPSADGGYCLIGVRSLQAAAPLFAPTPWSTSGVLGETLRRAADAGLEVRTLPPQRDIDEAADLDWLRAKLASGGERAASTRSALAALAEARGHD
jgi:rSAM/selenodomain-associated transferase 1